MKLTDIKECSCCGSTELRWHCSQKNLSGVADGRLRLNEVGTEFFLGCDSCSETLEVVSGDKVAMWMNKQAKAGN